MLKNIRHKPNGTAKASKLKLKKQSVTSDDSDYSGVDLISDSEEDEPDVEDAEEQAIIESEMEGDVVQPQQYGTDEIVHGTWNGFEVEDLNDPGAAYFEEQVATGDIPDVFLDATGWIEEAELESEDEEESLPETARRVRFDLSDSDSSPSDAEDNDHDSIFPDIFMDQGSLDPGFRRTIENDHNKDNDDPLSDDGSYWDFNGDEAELPDDVVDAAIANEEVTSSEESSGYETDEGETTEEELPPAARYLPARNVMRRQSTASSSSDEEDMQVIRRNPYRRNGPRLGSWVTDASKPFAVLDSRGKKLVMFKARINRQDSMNSSTHPTPRPYMEEDDHDLGDMTQMSPMISNSANMMMSAMYTPMDGLDGQALGPPEAFYPFVSVGANGNITKDVGSSSFDEDDVDDDDLWNIGDLIDFGDETGIEDEQAPADEEGDSCDSQTNGASRPTTANSDDHNHSLLNHLNSGIVGAFRRNQTRHQLLSRNSTSRDSLAFGGRYGTGAIRGIKGGRLAAANTPITPMRKTKAKIADPVVSPTPADGKKRKFVAESAPNAHKRNRSLF